MNSQRSKLTFLAIGDNRVDFTKVKVYLFCNWWTTGLISQRSSLPCFAIGERTGLISQRSKFTFFAIGGQRIDFPKVKVDFFAIGGQPDCFPKGQSLLFCNWWTTGLISPKSKLVLFGFVHNRLDFPKVKAYFFCIL